MQNPVRVEPIQISLLLSLFQSIADCQGEQPEGLAEEPQKGIRLLYRDGRCAISTKNGVQSVPLHLLPPNLRAVLEQSLEQWLVSWAFQHDLELSSCRVWQGGESRFGIAEA